MNVNTEKAVVTGIDITIPTLSVENDPGEFVVKEFNIAVDKEFVIGGLFNVGPKFRFY
jgi:hypothetical protein